eukprot:jgi/Mesen1/6398/ME000329S05554
MSNGGDAELDLYVVLGLEKGAESTAQEVKKAYRRKALESHPDKRPGDKDAAAEFNRIQRAYDVLSDDAARRAFDELARVRRERAERAGQSSAKRQKMMADLTARERAADEQKDEEDRARQRLRAELDRIRRQAAAAAQAQRAQQQQPPPNAPPPGVAAAEAAAGASSREELARTVKVSWEGGPGEEYSAEELQQLFGEVGPVEDVVLRAPKKKKKQHKGGALVVMKAAAAAVTASAFASRLPPLAHSGSCRLLLLRARGIFLTCGLVVEFRMPFLYLIKLCFDLSVLLLFLVKPGACSWDKLCGGVGNKKKASSCYMPCLALFVCLSLPPSAKFALCMCCAAMDAQLAATQRMLGKLSNPLLVVPAAPLVDAAPPPPGGVFAAGACQPTAAVGVAPGVLSSSARVGASFRDFESLTLMKMRQAAERARLEKAAREEQAQEEQQEQEREVADVPPQGPQQQQQQQQPLEVKQQQQKEQQVKVERGIEEVQAGNVGPADRAPELLLLLLLLLAARGDVRRRSRRRSGAVDQKCPSSARATRRRFEEPSGDVSSCGPREKTARAIK